MRLSFESCDFFLWKQWSPDCLDLDCVTDSGAFPRSPGGPCWPSRLNPNMQQPKHASRCFKPQAYARHTLAYVRIFEKDALTMLRKQALSRPSRASALPDCVTTEHGAAHASALSCLTLPSPGSAQYLESVEHDVHGDRRLRPLLQALPQPGSY